MEPCDSSVRGSQFSTYTVTPRSSWNLRGLILISDEEVGSLCTPEPLCEPDPHMLFDTLYPIQRSWGQGVSGLYSFTLGSFRYGRRQGDLLKLPVGGGGGGGRRCMYLRGRKLSSVAVTLVVRVPRSFITSLNVGSDSSSVVKPPSSGGWALFLILVVSPFLLGFIRVFNLGAIVS